jgi:pimeloyl-ACP methyl ester carboxylesterase
MVRGWGTGWPAGARLPWLHRPSRVRKRIPAARALRDDFRLIFADHRGQGRSDKPHDVASYALTTRVADAIAILNTLEIQKAHLHWLLVGCPSRIRFGARSGSRFVAGPVRKPAYEWPTRGPMLRAVSEAVAAGTREGMAAFVDTWEASIGERFPEPERSWVLANDPLALEAEFRSAFLEGPISRDLAKWDLPCLIYAGADDELHESAARAAAEIPGAIFLSLPGHTHFSAERVTDGLLPHVLELFRTATFTEVRDETP